MTDLDLSALLHADYRSASVNVKRLASLAEQNGASINATQALSSVFLNELNLAISTLSSHFQERLATVKDGSTDQESIQGLVDFAHVNYAAILNLLDVHLQSTGIDHSRLCLKRLRDLDMFTSEAFLRHRSSQNARCQIAYPQPLAEREWPWPHPSILPKDDILIRFRFPGRRQSIAIFDESNLGKAFEAFKMAGGTIDSVSYENDEIRVKLTLGDGVKGTFESLKAIQNAAYEEKWTVFFQLNNSGHFAEITHVATILCETGIPTTFWPLFSDIFRSFNLQFLSIKPLSNGSNPNAYEAGILAPQDFIPSDLTAKILQLGASTHVDVVIQAVSVFRTRKRLVIFDMDSTLIQQEVIDELARQAGVVAEVSKITEAAMNGEIDFKESLRQRVGLLKGTPTSVLEEVRKKITFTPGARKLCKALKRLGFKMAVISGGFIPLARYVKAELELDYAFANELKVSEDGLVLEGVTEGPVVDGVRKAELLDVISHSEGVKKEQVIAVGDGANDLMMLAASGLGVAFNAKPKVQEKLEDIFVLDIAIPSDFRMPSWNQMYSTETNGKSWSTLVAKVEDAGSTLIVVKDTKGHVFGAFASQELVPSPKFKGTSDTFLFALSPKIEVYKSAGINQNYQYFNYGTSTLPNGMGFGGQLEYFGLWIDSEFGKGHCRGDPSSTFGSPPLSSKEGDFLIEELECFLIKAKEVDDRLIPDSKKGKKSILDGDPSETAFLEMSGRVFASKNLESMPSVSGDPELNLA
ncbi:hypothetical protein HDU67_002967 [Dinochytrium kinnereticum]|nr:hypothetical protein HDU67_002967 [Dinochytrium kinnereticum]